jgi:hypothetical protein
LTPFLVGVLLIHGVQRSAARRGDNKMTVFTTEQEATEYAVKQYGALYVEQNIVNVIKIGPMVAKHLGCDVGYAIDNEM